MFIYPTACGRVKWLQRGPLQCLLAKDLMKLLMRKTFSEIVCVFDLWYFKSTCIPPRVTSSVASNGTPTLHSENTHSVSLHVSISRHTQSVCSPNLWWELSKILCVKTMWIYESPRIVGIYLIGLPNRTVPFVFSGETMKLCMGESENPNLRIKSP